MNSGRSVGLHADAGRNKHPKARTRSLKLEMVDHIDQKQCDARLMADMACGLFHALGSRCGGGSAGSFLRFSRASTSFIVNWLADSSSSR